MALCETYQQQLDYVLRKKGYDENCQSLTVSDPSGCRVGSGGGTINALNELILKFGKENILRSRVAIIHSGGDSRRSPLHSVTGKAWSALNVLGKHHSECPLSLLLGELEKLCVNIPIGSMVVASSDVLVNNDVTDAAYSIHIPNDSVSIFTVSTSPDIASNHGVLVKSSSDPQTENGDLDSVTFLVADYLQKPSIPRMTERNAIFHNHKSGNVALIDTGIVLFCGNAFQSFAQLIDEHEISSCTQMWKGEDNRRVRLELYSDILYALATEKGSISLNDFLSVLGQDDAGEHSTPFVRSLNSIWRIMHDIPFHGIHLLNGYFHHLGSTAELHEIYMTAVRSASSEPIFDINIAKHNNLKKIYNFQSQVDTIIAVEDYKNVSCSTGIFNQNILMNSCLYVHSSSVIGLNTIIEHSVLRGKCNIGSGCIVSSVGPFWGKDLHLPSDIVMQEVYTRVSESDMELPKSTVLVVFGKYDNIKAQYGDSGSTFCGISRSDFFRIGRNLICCDDLWDYNDTEKSIWTAKLFFTSYLADESQELWWLRYVEGIKIGKSDLCENCDGQTCDACLTTINQINYWKNAKRYSLSEILLHGDASTMLLWKLLLKSINIASHDWDTDQTGFDVVNSEHYRVPPLTESSPLCDISASISTFEPVNRAITKIARHFDGNVSIASSILLALWSIRLALPPEFLYSSASIDITQLLGNEDCGLRGDSTIVDIYNEFDSLWTTVYHTNYPCFGVVLNYLITRVDFLMPWNSVILSIISCFMKLISLENQPRLLFILHWLLGYDILVSNFDCNFDLSKVIANAKQKIVVVESNSLGELYQSGLNLLQVVFDLLLSLQLSHSGALKKNHKYDLLSFLEWSAQIMIRSHIEFDDCKVKFPSQVSDEKQASYVRHGSLIIARCPVRIDLAGGWSDTPPICYQSSGAVLNIAVNIDNICPMTCAAAFIDEPILRLKSLKVTQSSFAENGLRATEFECEHVDCDSLNHFKDFDPTNAKFPCVLLRACVVAAGILGGWRDSPEQHIRQFLAQKFGGGIELTCCSRIPSGSGMGGSSILAAVILKSLHSLLNPSVSSNENLLINMVSHVEQILTTGGGWQDQVGAIYGGLKIGRSNPQLPIAVNVERIPMCPEFVEHFNRRTILIYTGVQRLAKNTLLKALQCHSLFPIESYTSSRGIVSNLILDANTMAKRLLGLNENNKSSSDVINDAIDELGVTLNRYWEHKKGIASGSDTENLRRIVSTLQPISVGISACGAGAGGFVVCILKRDSCLADLEHLVHSLQTSGHQHSGNAKELGLLSVHTVSVNNVGVDVSVQSEMNNRSTEEYLKSTIF